MDLLIILLILCTAAKGDQFRTYPVKTYWGSGKVQRTTLYNLNNPVTSGLWNPVRQDGINSMGYTIIRDYPSPYKKYDNGYLLGSYPSNIKSDITNPLRLYENPATKNAFANSHYIYQHPQIIGNEKKSLNLYPEINDNFAKLLALYPKTEPVTELENLICKLLKIHGSISRYGMTNQLDVYQKHDIKERVENLPGLIWNSDGKHGIDHELCNFDNQAQSLAYYQACARKDAMTKPPELYQNTLVNDGKVNVDLYHFYQIPENKGFVLNENPINNNGVSPQGLYQNPVIKDPRANLVDLDQNSSFNEATTNSYSSSQNPYMNNGIANTIDVNLAPVNTDNFIYSTTFYPNAENLQQKVEDDMEQEFGFDETNSYKKTIITNQNLSTNDDNMANTLSFNENPNINDGDMATSLIEPQNLISDANSLDLNQNSYINAVNIVNSQDGYQNLNNINDENVANSIDLYQNSNINDGNMANPQNVYQNPNIKPQNIVNSLETHQDTSGVNKVSSVDLGQTPNVNDDNMANFISLQNPYVDYININNAFDMTQKPNFYDGRTENSFGMYKNPNIHDVSMANSLALYPNPAINNGLPGLYQQPDEELNDKIPDSFNLYKNLAPNDKYFSFPDFYQNSNVNNALQNSFGLYEKPGLNQNPYTNNGIENYFDFHNNPDIENSSDFEQYSNLNNKNRTNLFGMYNIPNIYHGNMPNSFGIYKNPNIYNGSMVNFFGITQNPNLNTGVSNIFDSQNSSINDGVSNSFGIYHKPDITGYDMTNLYKLYQKPDMNINMADSLNYYKNPEINEKIYSLPGLYQNSNLNNDITYSSDLYQKPGLYQNSFTDNDIENPYGFYQNTGSYQNPYINNGIGNSFHFYQNPDIANSPDFNQNPYMNYENMTNSFGMYNNSNIYNGNMTNINSFHVYHNPDITSYDMTKLSELYQKPDMNVNVADSLKYYKYPAINEKYYSLPSSYQNPNLNNGIANSISLYQKPGAYHKPGLYQKPDVYQNSLTNNDIVNPYGVYQNTGPYQNPYIKDKANSFNYYVKPGLYQDSYINSGIENSFGFQKPYGSSKNPALEMADAFSQNNDMDVLGFNHGRNHGMHSHSLPGPALNMAQSFYRIPQNNDKMAAYKNYRNPIYTHGFVPRNDINGDLFQHSPVAGPPDAYGSLDGHNLKVPMSGIVVTNTRDVDFPTDVIPTQSKPDEVKEMPNLEGLFANPKLGNQQSSEEINKENLTFEDDVASLADVTTSNPETPKDDSWWKDFKKKAAFVLQSFNGHSSRRRLYNQLGEHEIDRDQAGLHYSEYNQDNGDLLEA